MLIHALEMAPRPLLDSALEVAHHLREITAGTDLGHLIHMPSHIYVLLGEYQLAVQCNVDGVAAGATDLVVKMKPWI